VAGQRSHAAQLAGALLGRLQYERGETDAAERLLEESHELGAESGVADFMIATYASFARNKAWRGDLDEVWSILEEAHEAANQVARPRLQQFERGRQPSRCRPARLRVVVGAGTADVGIGMPGGRRTRVPRETFCEPI
jgi:ATP/maltotriose-dependent transcriptional regulator MalT